MPLMIKDDSGVFDFKKHTPSAKDFEVDTPGIKKNGIDESESINVTKGKLGNGMKKLREY